MITFSAEPHPTDIDLVRIGIRCCDCRSFNQFDIHEEDWFRGCFESHKGATIQSAFPTLSPPQRELLVSRICPRCFDGICHA
jgi:hypothetical protein